MMGNNRNRLRIDLFKKDVFKNRMKEQSELTFNGIHKSYENGDSFTFKQNEFLMDKPIDVGFAILESSKLHMYGTYYDKLQPYFTQQNLQCLYLDTDSFVFSMKTEKNNRDFKNLRNIFGFGNLDENYEIFSYENKKVIRNFKMEYP